jgi:hypothetical protein
MHSRLQSLRSASNEMPSPFSASSGQSTKYLARFSRHRRSAAVAPTRCYASRPWSHVVGSFHPSACGVGGGCRLSSSQGVVGASRRSAAPGGQSVGAAEYGGSFLSLRASSAVVMAKSGGVFAFASMWVVPTRDAQPFNREDVPRQAGSRLSSQTLGASSGPANPSHAA